jgi:RNA polymerase primary sigma factor
VNRSSVSGAKPLSQLLRVAVIAGVESAVQIHIERGDDINARDASGMTPLMLSAARNKPAICNLLLRAGADHSLLDPSGRTALQIAIAAGSDATAAILDAVQTRISDTPPPEGAPDPDSISDTSLPRGPITEAARPTVPGAAAANTEIEAPRSPQVAILDEMDAGEFDLSGWEAEEEPVRPVADLVVVVSASAVQVAITGHEPIDSSADWDDIDAYLPEVALPLARADDGEGRAALRRLFLRALREGSVPLLHVQAQSVNEDRSANLAAEAYLATVINDLGAELDERLEYSDACESFEVFVDPEETPEEEAALDEALLAIDRATSPRHEPLRIYQREIQRLRLLTADEEIQLAKDMEAALEEALDALAAWREGISRTLVAGDEALTGSRLLSSVWVGGETDSEPASAESLEAAEPPQSELEASLDEDGEQQEAASQDAHGTTFSDALRRLASLFGKEGGPRGSPEEIRQALAGLRLNRRFLLELVDAASGPAPCPEFGRAMADFRSARDRMAVANLKLAFFHAKKYLYSGEPLDDLAQEGNIGLLKAVDRYDWRRGFRFSTYATWWIRQQISRYVADKVRTVRVPVHIHEKLQKAERIAQEFEVALGRMPTLDELAERVEMPQHKLAALQSMTAQIASIEDLPIDSMIAIDAREAYVSPDPADVIDQTQLRREVDRYVSSLWTRDRKEESVIRLRFGIGVSDVLTLEEIGMRFEVTRERIRQIELKALRKLRHPGRSEPFGRMVLGMRTQENPPCHSEQEPDDDGLDGEDAPQSAGAEQPMAPKLSPQAIQTGTSSQATALDRALAKAANLGVPVEDGRDTPSGHIWVSLVETPDNLHRRLARTLLELGFEHAPGKGYWR